ncbi:NEW3 domain-containing protein [Caldalkalibacillus salinus]|uniref:COG1470 family protein n=1 Tax=Caldalkalibacillus salinus TaxID=2803787 RepID=UPI0019222D2B|nr:NEW3 domain-containing protein [Caldalkalibacillus salinus]
MKRIAYLLLTVMMLSLFQFTPTSMAATGLTLYTSYTGISVTPGESINYQFEIINNTNNVQQVSFDVENLPQDWQYELTSGGWQLQQLSIKPNDSESFSINLDVPLEVDKGAYAFNVLASSTSGLTTTLPATVTVTEKGTFKTELTSEQTNMEGHADATFSYDVSLRNRTAQEQHYALKANAPRGWDVNFQVDGSSVTSVTVESNATQDISVVLSPPQNIEAGEYEVPIAASTSGTSSELTLEAVVSGKYEIELTTPDGKLSEDIVAGRDKVVELLVSNSGTVPLSDITLEGNQPPNWAVEFEPSTINILEPGESETVRATITAGDNAIAGDYVVSMTANTPEASSSADFRMTVETSMLWGVIGVLIIGAVIAGVYYLMRQYGRR